jgi:hypothetical protein
MKKLIMKKLLLLTILSAFTAVAFAQIAKSPATTPAMTTSKKDAILSKQIISTTHVSPYQLKGVVPGFDLSIVAFSVRRLPDVTYDGQTKHKLQIDCTLRNNGAIDIPASKVSIGGEVSYAPQDVTGLSACGTTLGSQASDILKSGETRSITYYCTMNFPDNQHLYYNLRITANDRAENNLQNNAAQSTIPQ